MLEELLASYADSVTLVETKCDYNKITEKKAVRYTYDVTLSSKETAGRFIDTLVERKILFTFGIPKEKRQVRL